MVVVTVGVYLVVTGVFVAGWTLGAEWRGSTAGTGPSFWSNIVWVVVRSAVGVALLAMITAGLALVTRGTVGALVIWIGYVIGVEGILANRIPKLRPSLLIENLAPFLEGRTLRTRFQGAGTGADIVIHPGTALVYLVVVVAVVVAIGVVAFRTRDVT